MYKIENGQNRKLSLLGFIKKNDRVFNVLLYKKIKLKMDKIKFPIVYHFLSFTLHFWHMIANLHWHFPIWPQDKEHYKFNGLYFKHCLEQKLQLFGN